MRRFFAFSIDVTVLAVPAFYIAYRFFDEIAALGQYGRLIGFGAVVFYFAVWDSRVGGQTLGKRLLGVRVVSGDGKPIGLGRAGLRALVFFVPLLLVGLDLRLLFPDAPVPLYATVLSTFLIVGIGGASLYLLAANRGTRQLVHDLATETFVAPASHEGRTPTRLAPTHWFVVLGIFAVSLATPFVPLAWFETWQPARDFVLPLRLKRSLAEDRSFMLAGYSVESETSIGPDGNWSMVTSRVSIAVVLHRPGDLHSVIDKVAAETLLLEPDLMGYRDLAVTASYGADLGIANWMDSKSVEASLEQWRGRLSKQPRDAALKRALR